MENQVKIIKPEMMFVRFILHMVVYGILFSLLFFPISILVYPNKEASLASGKVMVDLVFNLGLNVAILFAAFKGAFYKRGLERIDVTKFKWMLVILGIACVIIIAVVESNGGKTTIAGGFAENFHGFLPSFNFNKRIPRNSSIEYIAATVISFAFIIWHTEFTLLKNKTVETHEKKMN